MRLPSSKKGDKSDLNYRPISLIYVLCKVLEHIVASNLTKHLANFNILFELQDGFMEKRSCETQLVMLVDEIAKNMQIWKQTDLILLDFSKAFDKIAPEKLISKLHFYGIRGKTLSWVKDFLDSRSQAVVLNGVKSDKIAVSSGVPQVSVLGPILFLAYIIDLPDQVKSRVRLFADYTAIYLAISSEGESITLQNDLHAPRQSSLTNHASLASHNEQKKKKKKSLIIINVCIDRRTEWKTGIRAKFVILLKYRNYYYYYYYN